MAAFIPALSYCLRELSSSGFYEYLSLTISDGGVTLSYWKDLAIILLESFPVVGIVIVVGALLLFLVTLKKSVSDMNIIWGDRARVMV